VLSFYGRPENYFQDPLPQFIPDGYKAAFHRIDCDPNSKLIVVEKNGIVIGTFQMTYSLLQKLWDILNKKF